ncbi:RNA ligase family protein [Paenibacillus sp. GCM10027628]|uniref:ATP-dependent DNA ligase n=1 Tax=Paenibacillus sp. GCM10027628 TaxID=3273413 RepID=UPI003633540B
MFISPMLVPYAKDNQPFNRKNHIVEQKLDGIRCLISKMDQLYIYTKHHQLVTHKFPELHNCPFPDGTILDGELIVPDHRGNPDFEGMSARLYSRNHKSAPVLFYAFDILRYKGIDVTSLPLLRRKEMLEEAFLDTEHYKKISVFEGKASDYFEHIQQQALEGIVIKRADSKYAASKRLKSWQKVINWVYADVYISGYRKKDLSLLASIDATNGLKIPVGVIELGLSQEHKNAIHLVKNRLVYKEDTHFAYMEPLLMAKIKTRNWTKSGKLRAPIFMDFVI